MALPLRNERGPKELTLRGKWKQSIPTIHFQWKLNCGFAAFLVSAAIKQKQINFINFFLFSFREKEIKSIITVS